MELFMILISLIVASAVGAIIATYHSRHRWFYVLKPLTTTLIIVVALTMDAASDPSYRWLIVTGLIAGMAGDIFLMLDDRYFIGGLIAFLVGHLLYCAAFYLDVAGVLYWPLIPLLMFGIITYRVLHGNLGPMRVPVIIYTIVLITMAWLAMERWYNLASASAAYAAIGAVIFVSSDATLALDRFRRPFRSAQAIILGTYWMAQLLIALSVGQ